MSNGEFVSGDRPPHFYHRQCRRVKLPVHQKPCPALYRAFSCPFSCFPSRVFFMVSSSSLANNSCVRRTFARETKSCFWSAVFSRGWSSPFTGACFGELESIGIHPA